MEVHPHLESDRIDLAFEDDGKLRDFVDAARTQGAFLLELTALPTPLASYTIGLRLDSEFEAEFVATVVQLFEAPGGGSAAFQLEPLSRGWTLEFERRLRQAREPEKDHSEMTGVPPIVRIRRMNVRERMHLATKADRTERAALLRDGSPQVLTGLLTNPRIGAEKALVRNPKTPAPIALRLVGSLPTEELRKLAKIQSGLREELRKAALRVYLKRSQR